MSASGHATGRSHALREPIAAPAFGLGIDGQQRIGGSKRIAGYGRGQLHILLNHVRAVRRDALGEEPVRRPLARPGLANAAHAAGHAANDRRADGALQVEHRVVLGGAQLTAQFLDLVKGLAAQWMALPVAARGKVQPVDKRHGAAAGFAVPCT